MKGTIIKLDSVMDLHDDRDRTPIRFSMDRSNDNALRYSTDQSEDHTMRLSRKSPKSTAESRRLAVRKTGSRSYVELITEAILNSSNQRLTANEIYECMVHNVNLDHSPSSLKNTIRHTLSWYKRFKRVQRGTLQKPAWWTVDLEAEPPKKTTKPAQYQQMDDDCTNMEQELSPNNSLQVWANNGAYDTSIDSKDSYNYPTPVQNYFFMHSASSNNIEAQSATVVTERGVVYGVDVPSPLQVKVNLHEVKETQTWAGNNLAPMNTRYRNRLSNCFTSCGRRNYCGELCLAPLPADLESIDVETGAECDIIRVLQQEMDLEGRVDLDCLRNFVSYTNI